MLEQLKPTAIAARIRAARDWIHHPDQVLYRIEARWVLRWFTRFPGWAFLILYIIADFLILNREWLYLRATGMELGREGPSGVTLFLLTKAGFWLYFIRRRIVRFFRPERLESLASTPLTGKDLWPALCTAPALALVVFMVIDCVLFQIHIIADPEWHLSIPSLLMDLLLLGILMLGMIPALAIYPTVCAVAQSAPEFRWTTLLWKGFWASFRGVILVGGLMFIPIILPVGLAKWLLPDWAWIGTALSFVLVPLGCYIGLLAIKQGSLDEAEILGKKMIPQKLLEDFQWEEEDRRRERAFRVNDPL